MEEDTQEQGNISVDRRLEALKPYQYRKGQSGNPGGRPKGISLKEYARNKLLTMTENGLEWGLHVDKEMTWQEAMDYVKSLGEGWRLPTIKELVAITDYSKINSVTHLGFEPDRNYWSSTEVAGLKDYAYSWSTYFGSVNFYDKGYKLSVQAVR